jgi:O-antigen/teichoic acid export membrane protein
MGGNAIRGGLWTAIQVVVNKAVSMAGTLANLYLLAPGEVGIAAIALSVQSLVMVMPAFTLSDALIARPASVRAFMPIAYRLCLAVSVPMMMLLLAWGFWKADAERDRAYLLAGLAVAFRPVADLMLLGPQTRLRSDLEFAAMSRIDMVCFLASTASTVAMAATGFSSLSILVPPIAFTAVRAWAYRRAERRPRQDSAPVEPGVGRRMFREYALSGLGQYVHGGMFMSAPLIIDHFFGAAATGLFQNAFLLSSVINSVVATGIGLVLQPIFAQMDQDPERQSQAFVRACGAIAAVAMPACVCQSVVVSPLLRLALPESWMGAIPMAVLMSAGMAFYFPVNPAMALLKAQRRFTAFFVWQGAQLALVIGGMFATAVLLEEKGPMPVVAVYASYHLLMSPIGVWLCVRRTGASKNALVSVFVLPLAATLASLLPVALLAFVTHSLPDFAARDLLTAIVAPAVMLPAYSLALRRLAPDTWNDCLQISGALLAGVARRRR